MGRFTGSYFENPYLEEGEHAPSAEIIMEEARQRWRTGQWRPKSDSFAIDRMQIAGDSDSRSAPPSARFALDLKRDLMGDGISLESLRELSYTPSYRPKGQLDKLEEDTFVKMSTLQRYDVLAGELEAPPDDVSFLSDAQSRHEKEVTRSGKKKDGSLRRDTRRLSASLDSRRSEILRLLPAEEDDTTSIIDESKRRKAREDKELGRITEDSSGLDAAQRSSLAAKDKADSKKRRRDYLAGLDFGDGPELSVRPVGERFGNLPEQVGMNSDGRQLPEFESQTRYWSRIHEENPTWSEVAAITESSAPGEGSDNDHSPRYVDEDLFDENRPYQQILPPRRRIRSTDAGHYDTEYIRSEGIDPRRIREIMDKEYRGRWVPPEFFADDDMVSEWFNQYNRGALSGEDYLRWAYRQKAMEQEQLIAEQQAAYEAEQARPRPVYHQEPRARRYSPFSQNHGDPRQADRDLMAQQYAAARREGFSHGADFSRRAEMREREYERSYYGDDHGYSRRDDYDDRDYGRRGGYDDRDYGRRGGYDDRDYGRRGGYDDRRYSRGGHPGDGYYDTFDDEDAPPAPVFPRKRRR